MNNTEQFVTDVFRSIDRMEAGIFAGFFTEEGEFRFGNMPSVVGRSAIEEFTNGFFKAIKGIRHTELQHWLSGNYLLVNGRVAYTRHDGSGLVVPFSVTWKLVGDKIANYLVFVDNSALFSK